MCVRLFPQYFLKLQRFFYDANAVHRIVKFESFGAIHVDPLGFLGILLFVFIEIFSANFSADMFA